MIRFILRAGRTRVLSATLAVVALIAAADWQAGNRASLGVLYILPMMLSGIVLPAPGTAVLAVICSSLRSVFDIAGDPRVEVFLRFLFATLAYALCGLFTAGLVRNRDLEEQLRTLVESSPAGILTIGPDGKVLAANRAANLLFTGAERNALRGRSIADYLPVLTDALNFDAGPDGLRTTAQCQGHRDNGEIFLAQTWFSSYDAPHGRRVAAIVADASEELRDREEVGLRQMMKANRIAAAGVSHEVRHLCGAIAVMTVNLKEKHALASDEDFEALTALVGGLERVASLELQTHGGDLPEDVDLRAVLDDLRIVTEPQWREIGGTIHWKLPEQLPRVLADSHGLLQAFLNLADNSHRAVQEMELRRLWVTASKDDQKVMIRFTDSGPGVAEPDRLFAPFQPGAGGSGLGLYVSRAMVRGCGGDIKFEPREHGACFRVELMIVT